MTEDKDDFLIIIRSLDDLHWERYGDFSKHFFGCKGGERFIDEIRKEIHECEDYEEYYWELVSLHHFNEFRKPFM